jgi:hypothetical protein
MTNAVHEVGRTPREPSDTLTISIDKRYVQKTGKVEDKRLIRTPASP